MKSKDYKIMTISDHAFERLKQRSGLNKSAAIRISEKAYKLGLTHSECKGNLFKWVCGTTRASKAGSSFRVYGDKLWIFTREKIEGTQNYEVKLITVLQVPPNLKSSVDTLMAKKKEKQL